MVVVLVEERAGTGIALPQIQVGVGVAGLQGDGHLGVLGQVEAVVAGVAARPFLGIAARGPLAGHAAVARQRLVAGVHGQRRGASAQAHDGQREAAGFARAVCGGLDGVGSGGQGCLYLRNAQAALVIVVLVEEGPGAGVALPQVQVGVGVSGFQGDGHLGVLGQVEGVVAGVSACAFPGLAACGPLPGHAAVGGERLATGVAGRRRDSSAQARDGDGEAAGLPRAVGRRLYGIGSGGQGFLYLRNAQAALVVVVLVQERPGAGFPFPQVEIGISVVGLQGNGDFRLLGQVEGVVASVSACAFPGLAACGPLPGHAAVAHQRLAAVFHGRRRRDSSAQARDGQREVAGFPCAVGRPLYGVGSGGQSFLYLRNAQAALVVVVLIEERAGAGVAFPQVEVGVGVVGFQGYGDVRLLGQVEGVIASVSTVAFPGIAACGPLPGHAAVARQRLAAVAGRRGDIQRRQHGEAMPPRVVGVGGFPLLRVFFQVGGNLGWRILGEPLANQCRHSRHVGRGLAGASEPAVFSVPRI